MAKSEKGSKEFQESKQKAREELDAADAGAPRLRDSTVGHQEGPPGTWNTSGVEVPMNAASVRDVRPETGDVVSLEGLKELGVPVRDESDYRAGQEPAPAPVAAPETEDRTMQISAAREAVEASEADEKKAAKEGKTDEKK